MTRLYRAKLAFFIILFILTLHFISFFLFLRQSQQDGHVTGGTLNSNPCTQINLSQGKIYFAYPGDVHKFIECDLVGNANILVCPSNLVWDETILSCAYSFTAGQPPTDDPTVLTGEYRQHSSNTKNIIFISRISKYEI